MKLTVSQICRIRSFYNVGFRYNTIISGNYMKITKLVLLTIN